MSEFPGHDEANEIRQIQDRMGDRYRPREGETWADAADASGKLQARVSILLFSELRGGEVNIEALNRDELEQLVALLERIKG